MENKPLLSPPSLSPEFCRRLVWVAALLVAGYGLCLSLGSNAGFPESMRYASKMPYLADKPLGEDAFYMMHVAWNLASGRGPVCNEGQVVTGFQPLTTLVYAGLAWVDLRAGGDVWTFLRLVLLFNVLLLLVFAALVGNIAATLSKHRKYAAYCLGFLLSVFGFMAFSYFTYGLETGMYLTALAAIMLFSLRHIPFHTWREVVAFGLLGGGCGWCRIDFGICFAVFLLAMLLGRVMTLKQCLVSGGVALLVIAPWFAWVYSVSGSAMPSSGIVESGWMRWDTAGARLTVMGWSLVENLAPWMYAADRWPLKAVKALSLLACLVALFAGRRHMRGALCGGRVWLGWVLAISALAPVYLLCFWSMHFYGRYTSPLLIVASAFFAAAGVELAAGVLGSRKGLLATGLLLCCVFAALAVGTFHNHRSRNGFSVTAGFVRQNLSHLKHVGAFQSGTIGFFNPNVVNLDGKVNAAVQPFRLQGKMTEYIDQAGIDAIVDWSWVIRIFVPDPWLEKGWSLSTQNLHSVICECYLRRSNSAAADAAGH